MTFLRFTPFILSLGTTFANDAADIVVYGGTAGGVAAAIQGAKMGHHVVLIEPTQHLGGLTSGGLGMTDSGKKEAIGGLSRQFYQRIKAHYLKADSWNHEEPKAFKPLNESKDALWRFEPKVAEKVLREMLAEQPVQLVSGERLDLKNGVSKTDGSIRSIRMESGRTFQGKVFIDATYEGDLLAKAGVSYHVGREANSVYDETLNGVQLKQAKSHQFTKPISGYVKPGDAASGLLPGVSQEPPGEEGAGDKKVQAYNFRLCMTKVAANKLPWPKPANYDPLRYELGLRYALAGNTTWHHPAEMPNGKTDTNNNGGFSTDNIGHNYDFPEADYATRDRIIQEHREYQQGLYWFFANDPRVPAPVQKEFQSWGLAKDEFTDNGNWPHQIYVREARRMVGTYVQTEQDCRRSRTTPQSIGLGSYNMDSHHVQRWIDADGHVHNEGDVQVSPGGAYAIAYGSITPQKAECQNLLVPVCLSSSHIAYGSIRMEPVFMILGQSAATAASIAIKSSLAVQDVPYEQLEKRLLADGQVLKADAPSQLAKLPGIVVDDAQAERTGEWTQSHANSPYVGSGYLHDGDAGKGDKKVIFTANLPKAGKYELRILWPRNDNRAKNVPVTFSTAEGEKTVEVNQAALYEVPPVGTHAFPAGEVKVSISNAGTKGHVVVDAVQFLPK
jgi:hypothetical protein